MTSLVNFLKENFFNIIGVLSFAFSIYIYLKAKSRKCPMYYISSFQLLDSEIKNIKNIEIKYLDRIINNLTASKFAFWNDGKKTILEDDIPTSSPLKITSKDNIEIFNAEIKYVTNDSNNIVIKQSKKEIIIKFEYLDKYQGAVINILHSGQSSDDLIINGDIKGVGKYKLSTSKPYEDDEPPLWGYIIFLVCFVLGAIIAKSSGWKIFFISFSALICYAIFIKLREPKFPKELKDKFF
jgi:hypothetical protein